MWLERAADTGLRCYPWFERDTLLDPVRRHPRFGRLIARLKDAHETAAPPVLSPFRSRRKGVNACALLTVSRVPPKRKPRD
jgi:hypothetical protein